MENWTVTSTGNDFTVYKGIIKKGDKFVCTSDVVMDGGNHDKDRAYTTGKIYTSDQDDCITNNWGQKDHWWTPGTEWYNYFQPYEECCGRCNGVDDICVTDRPHKDYFQSMMEEGMEQYGKRTFESGAVRDSNENKPLVHCLLGYTRQRFGYHMSKNANKYGKNNFMKGIPTEAYLESMDRHLAAYMEGDRSEDHLSAILFGVNGIMLNEKGAGVKPDEYFLFKEKQGE